MSEDIEVYYLLKETNNQKEQLKFCGFDFFTLVNKKWLNYMSY